MSKVKLAIALDFVEIEDAERFLYDIEDKDLIIKIGYSLFIKYGKDITDFVKNRGFQLFLDLKLHDIPNTVYNGVKGAVYSGADYLTIHTFGGKDILEMAVKAAKDSNLKLLGVTILTSHSQSYLSFLGSSYSIDQLALKLAKEAVEIGVHGIVSSALEVEKLKSDIDKDFIAVTPGIRPEKILEDNQKDDQKRVVSIEEAVKFGSDIIVVGRPIIKSENPNKVIKKIKEKLRK